jgi:TatD DNase family protein
MRVVFHLGFVSDDCVQTPTPPGKRQTMIQNDAGCCASHDAEDACAAASPATAERAAAPYVLDSHCHFRAQRAVDGEEGVAALALLAAGDGAVARRALVCGTSPTTDWTRIVHLASLDGPPISCGFGLHPWFVAEATAATPTWPAQLEALLTAFPRSWVAEIGLDKLRAGNDGDAFAAQVAAFEMQLDLAARLRRPVSVHCVRSHGAMLELFQRRPLERFPTRIVMHGFTGSHELARALVGMSAGRGARFLFGLGAATTGRLKHFESLVASIPRDRVLVESDCFVDDAADAARGRQLLWAMSERLLSIDSALDEARLQANFDRILADFA